MPDGAHDVKANIPAKIESFNLAGSVKGHSAFAMIEALETAGKIGPVTELIEATSGNNGVAWVSAIKDSRRPSSCPSTCPYSTAKCRLCSVPT